MKRLGAITILAVFVLAARGVAQSVVELRSTVRGAPGVPITLGQAAALSGPEAVALAGVPLAPSGSPPAITLDEVRRAIDAQGTAEGKHINWGRITLRGSSCFVLAAGQAEPRAPAPRAVESATPPVPGTIRAGVAARIAQILGVTTADLKLTFAPEDDSLLDTPAAGRTVEIRATGSSDRLPLSISVFQGDRTVISRTIRVGIQVRRDVLIARSPQRRGDAIALDEVETETRYLGPTARPASREQAIGATAQSRIDPGEIIMENDVAPGTVVTKGQIVTVRCVSGSIVLTTRARAMADARDGELVQFQAVDSPRTFFARMDGKGRAVVTAGDAVPADSSARSAPARARSGRIAPPSTAALEAAR